MKTLPQTKSVTTERIAGGVITTDKLGGPGRKAARESLSVPFEVKAGTANDGTRTFQGLASTWSLDLGGDVIHPGAYTRTLGLWRASGKVIPLVDLHSYDSVRQVVGKMVEATETADGLLATFQILEAGDPTADAAWMRVKGGYITGLSIGYRAIRYEYEQPEGTDSYYDRIRHLTEVELKEVSLVIWGMNEEAQIDAGSIKSLTDALRAGTLTDEERKELRALLEAAPPENPGTPTPGLAPEDPKRLAMEATLRDLTLRSLGTRA
jgi:HK97 family phage prohead protease